MDDSLPRVLISFWVSPNLMNENLQGRIQKFESVCVWGGGGGGGDWGAQKNRVPNYHVTALTPF